MPGLTLGNKINNYRKRAGMSQLEMEVELGASPGMISRIENGKVNPTKETLKHIINVLNLTKKEAADLLELVSLHPSEEEISAAIAEVAEFMQRPDRFGYLVDDWWIIRAFSKGLAQLLGFTNEHANSFIGENLIEVMFKPEFKVRGLIDPEKIIDVFGLELARARAELNTEFYGEYFQQEVTNIRQVPGFDDIYEKSLEVNKDLVSAGSRVSYLVLGGKRIKLYHMREKLKQNPRFELVEFVGPEVY